MANHKYENDEIWTALADMPDGSTFARDMAVRWARRALDSAGVTDPRLWMCLEAAEESSNVTLGDVCLEQAHALAVSVVAACPSTDPAMYAKLAVVAATMRNALVGALYASEHAARNEEACGGITYDAELDRQLYEICP